MLGRSQCFVHSCQLFSLVVLALHLTAPTGCQLCAMIQHFTGLLLLTSLFDHTSFTHFFFSPRDMPLRGVSLSCYWAILPMRVLLKLIMVNLTANRSLCNTAHPFLAVISMMVHDDAWSVYSSFVVLFSFMG